MRLIASSLLPVEGEWQLADVLEAYRKFRDLENPDGRYPVPSMEDAVSVCAWLGEQDKAAAQASRYVEEAKSWPEYVLSRQGGLLRWHETLNGLASSGNKLRQIAEEQVEALKLKKVPVSQLLP